ncbi:hypothetical protein Tco_0985731, partial [Tanacetum coccineum]
VLVIEGGDEGGDDGRGSSGAVGFSGRKVESEYHLPLQPPQAHPEYGNATATVGVKAY